LKKILSCFIAASHERLPSLNVGQNGQRHPAPRSGPPENLPSGRAQRRRDHALSVTSQRSLVIRWALGFISAQVASSMSAGRCTSAASFEDVVDNVFDEEYVLFRPVSDRTESFRPTAPLDADPDKVRTKFVKWRVFDFRRPSSLNDGILYARD